MTVAEEPTATRTFAAPAASAPPIAPVAGPPPAAATRRLDYPAVPFPTPPYPTAPPATHDEFTALNLLVPRQQAFPGRALFWGIVSALFLNVALLPGVFAILFGVLGIRRARRMERLGMVPEGLGKSVVGLVLGGVGIVSGIALAVVLLPLMRG